MRDLAKLYAVIDATWPAAEIRKVGQVTIRRGLGGGSRVSAATAPGSLTPNELANSEQAMRAWDQTPRFMIRFGNTALDTQLAAAGYVPHDKTQIYLCPITEIARERPPPVSTFVTWPPLAVQQEIWAAGGIGPERIAIMERAKGQKATILGRVDDRPAGTLYVACENDIAMVHAVEVLPEYRRRGLARYLMSAAGFWAIDRGMTHLALLTTQANTAANPLYASLGMDVVGQYHYRKLPE
ncbi:Acetyltransferase (GNAT) family protein [Cognatiyoonia koreensis]|uniref:Acetyltransferase (GNAT) family protein n=1 Tax=Cognatiyoonia koreensis TaxID=364200 RepID=A0A1I0REW2_9RHOB|nr:GNAT family N-acetyltransferase [Cognatiyoonia koreensis]SEW39438.1 Acetyltransferase (GNAT) family protein [Cognatiyoonia koreensis]